MSEVMPRYWLPSGTLTQQHPYGLDDTCVVPDWAYDKLKKDYDQLRAELAARKAGQGEAVGHPINLALSRDVGEILESVGINRSTVGGQRIIACCERAVARSSAAQPDKAREVLARLFCAVEHAETDTGGILVDCELQDEVRAAITAPPASADAVSVPVELLKSAINAVEYLALRADDIGTDNVTVAKELRALLAQSQGVKP